jgi:hypothetical protein
MANVPLNRTRVTSTDLVAIYVADRGIVQTATVWSEAFYTLKNSLSITQTSPDKTEIFVDQEQAAEAVKYGTGTFDIKFQIPDTSTALLSQFFTEVAATNPSQTGESGKTGTGYSTGLNSLNSSKMIKLVWSDATGIIYTNVDMVGVQNKSGDGAFLIDVTATVLAGGGAGFEPSTFIRIV